MTDRTEKNRQNHIGGDLLTFHRHYLSRSCRVEARYIGDGKYAVAVVGDYIPTRDYEIHETGISGLFESAKGIFREWLEIAIARVPKETRT